MTRGGRLAELDAAMSAPDYEPILASPADVARLFGVTRQAVSRWSARTDRTGVDRFEGGKVDVNAVARWLLRRDHSKVTRGTRHADS